MKLTLHTVRSFLGGVSLTVLARDSAVMNTARTLVSYYYYALPITAFMFLTSGTHSDSNFAPFFPIAWISWLGLDFDTALLLLKLGLVIVAIASILLHQHRLMRIAVFAVFFQIHGFESSFGSMNHQWYGWLYTSFVFIFLPNIWKKETLERNRFFLLFIWFAQAMIALIYTLAGTHKLIYAVVQGLHGEIGGFHPFAFAYRVADWVLKLQDQALLAPYVIDYPYVSWLPYVFIHFLQFFSLWVMVRVRLQRMWGAIIILFHIGTTLTMGISFNQMIVLVMVLFLNSPFLRPYSSFSEFVLDLPLLGQLYGYVRRKVTSLRRTAPG